MSESERAWLVIGVVSFVLFFLVGFTLDHFTKRVVKDPDSERLHRLIDEAQMKRRSREP